LRLAIVSPFLDRQHGTELCIVEQIERLVLHDQWTIDLYSQRVSQVRNIKVAASGVDKQSGGIYWHRISRIPGPHLLGYCWWFLANQIRRWRDKSSGRIRPDLTYSPGINCLDANVIVVHIVFHEFYRQVERELLLRRMPISTWPLILHRKLYYKLIMSLERKIYRKSNVRLIAVSSVVASQLQNHFGRTDVSIIPNSVDTQRFNLDECSARRTKSRRRHGFSEEDFVLLFIGNDWKKKGLDALLRACALLRDFPLQLMVVGRDDQDIYQALLEQLALEGRVRFEKPSIDVLSFYASADIYVSPALEDAFGLPILESMACGLAVIASVYAGASDNIRNGETGLLLQDPRDPAEIAERISLLFSDRALRQRLGSAGAQYAKANCSWDQNASKTKEVLEATFVQLHKN
jgi:glycosyltransferase involved in cell wall biosynthesis